MEVLKHQKGENSSYEISAKINVDIFKAAVSDVFKKNSKQFNVPGFRKGKAPRHLIEKMYGEDVFYSDAINNIFPAEYEAVIAELGIEPVDRPSVDIESVNTTDGVLLNITVIVKPEIKIGKFKGLSAEKADNTVSDKEIDERIEDMQKRNARLITREGKAENGDSTNINFEGFVDGVPFEGGKGEDFNLVLGSGQFIPGFEEQIVGHTAGDEFDVTVTFPEQYHSEDLAGKESVFKVKLNEVKFNELPELDDEFVKDVSEFDTLDALRDSIKTEIAERKEKEGETAFEDALISQIIETIEGDIPSVMFENRISDMVYDFERRLQGQGLNLDTYMKYVGQDKDSFRKGFEEEATRQVKTRLALEKIVETESIQASDEDLQKEIERIAEAYKMEAEKVREIIPTDDVKKDIALNKALDLVKESAKVTAKKTKKPATKKKTVKKEETNE